MECLIKTCTATKSHCRGLCMKHYSIAVLKVKKGETSWKELYELGLCKLKKSPNTKSKELLDFEEQLAASRINTAKQ